MNGTIVLSKEQRAKLDARKRDHKLVKKILSRDDVIAYYHQAGRVAFTGGVKPLKEKA